MEEIEQGTHRVVKGHRFQTALYGTCYVRDRDSGDVMQINKDDFNPSKHEKVDPPKRRRRRLTADAEKAKVEAEELDTDEGELPSREQLEQMKVSELKKLPQWKDVENKADLKRKEDIVDALLLA